MTQDGGLSSLMGNRNQRSCVREWSSSRLVGDSETDIHRRLDAFLTHWMQARSIGPNCGGSDGFSTSAHLMPICIGRAGDRSSPKMSCAMLTHPVENSPPDGWLLLAGPSFR